MPAATEARPHYERPLLTSAFFERSRHLVQTDQYVPWSGYTTVDVYSSIEQEYFAIRNSASVFDLTPMVKYRITGPDSERYLNRLVTRDVGKLKPGQVAYAVWCDESGHLIDDGTIFRFGPAEFRLCTAERQLDWLLDSAIGFDVDIADITEQVAALALQGPTSCAVLKAMGLAGVELLKPFQIGHFRLADFALMVSRTGFTGDLGYELWIDSDGASSLWDRLMDTGEAYGIRVIGYRALDMARIEAGFVLPNVDFISAAQTIRLNRETTPFELGLDRLVAFEKGHFNGRRALLAERARGPRRRLLGIEIAGRKAGHGSLIYDSRKGARQVGEVKSALWSPTCKRNIALAMIDAPYFQSLREFWVDIYLHRELTWERRMERAWPVERPFFAPERRTATPPADR
ncbi:MAG: aminomethyltransferase family protein [Burkholderiaceae bacterium]|nr:aminomethyltransferase family protein [Burkholderiaceae bacterium]